MPTIAPAHDGLSFNSVRDLLNPKFESYKLDPAPASSSSFPLPAGTKVGQIDFPDSARLSLVESQALARHNHLRVNEAGVVLFVDVELNVIVVSFDQTLKPSFNKVAQLPVPVKTASSSDAVLEYPDALPIPGSATDWVVSDGTGRLYGLTIASNGAQSAPSWSAELVRADESNELRPLRLHSVDRLKNGQLVALISSVVKMKRRVELPTKESVDRGKASAVPSNTSFEFLIVALPTNGHRNLKLEAFWTLYSHDLPSYVHFDPVNETYVVTAASLLTKDAPQVIGHAHHHFPHHDDDDDHNIEEATTSQQASEKKATERPPSYSWSQDKDSLTVVFAIPSDTPTASIRINMSKDFVSVFVGSPAAAIQDEPSRFVKISHKKLWDSIDPHSSVWTFDRDAEGRNSSYGLLSLHLEKQNAGTRWTNVFAQTAGVADQEEARLEQVAETLDASELAAISERMEQWSREVGSHLTDRVGGEMPASLTGDEIDVEIDASAGRPLYLTWISDLLSRTDEEGPTVKHPHPTVPFSLLTTPLMRSGAPQPEPSVVISHDVDGALFVPGAFGEPWKHETTFPALSFVLATKQHARYVHHVDRSHVIAFDNPWHSQYASPEAARNAGAGNLFVYERPAGKRDAIGRQRVYRVGTTSSGQLKGVVGLAGQALVALCENELVVFPKA